MEKLNESKPFDKVFGDDPSIKYSYEQGGKFFNSRKVRIDPETGIVWDADSVSELGLKEPVSSEPKVMGAHKDLPFKPNLGSIVGNASKAPRIVLIEASDSADISDEGIVETDNHGYLSGIEEEKEETPKPRRTMSLKKAK